MKVYSMLLGAAIVAATSSAQSSSTTNAPPTPVPGPGVIGVRTEDPRCVNVNCDDLQRPFSAKTIANFPSDPTTCANGTFCPRCLTDTELWGPLLDAVGNGTALRSMIPTLVINNWLSAELVDNIANILLQEAMGFTVDTAPIGIDGTTEILCCKDNLIELEKWLTGTIVDDDGYFNLKHSGIGYQGASGLFVPDHTVTAYPLATAFNAYKYLSEYQHILPRGMSTNCTKLIVNQSLGCVEGNYICDKGASSGRWPNTTCTQGRYVPPQCQAAPQNCSEVFMADPTWDSGYFEGLIKNTGLPFVTTYLGSKGLAEELAAQKANGSHFMFYWWEPDPLTASVGAEPVNFPPYNLECEQKRSVDPTNSGHDCGYPQSDLQKYARRDTLEQDPDLEYFFDKFALPSSGLNAMLQSHKAAGGDRQVWNLTCDWVRGNYATWKDWVKNTPPPVSNTSNSDSDSVDLPLVIGLGVAIPVSVIILVVVVLALFLRQRAAKAVKHAPTKAPLSMVFTDIQSSTLLWEQYGTSMATAVEMHHEIIRDIIDKHECYEVKTIGDAFIFCSQSLLDVTMAVMEIQRALQAAPWPEELMHWKNEEPNPLEGLTSSGLQMELFKGIRVRVGIHYCTEIDAKFDQIHGRFDYYGHDMNVSARVQSIAAGGQVLMTEDTWRVLASDAQFDVLSEEVAVKCVSRGATLKGVADPVPIFQILPSELQYRQFPPLEGAVDENVRMGASIRMGNSFFGRSQASSETISQASEAPTDASMLGGEARDRFAAIKQSLDIVIKGVGESQRERDAFVHKIANHCGVVQAPTMRRLAMLRQSLLTTVNTTLGRTTTGAPIPGGNESSNGSSNGDWALPVVLAEGRPGSKLGGFCLGRPPDISMENPVETPETGIVSCGSRQMTSSMTPDNRVEDP